MADELTPDTGVEIPEPAVAPEPAAPEPATPPEPVQPEPEPQPPDWLRDIGGPPEPDKPVEPAAPQPQQPQQPQYPQYPQQPTTDQKLERLVNDPDAYVLGLVEQRAKQLFEQQLGPVAYNLQQMEQKTDAYQQVAARNMVNQTKSVVDQGYRSVIGKDPAYRENEVVKNYVDTEMQKMLASASEQAYRGYPEALQMFHDPRFFNGFMALAKSNVGYMPNAVGPATPAGAVVEGATPPQPTEVIQLPPELELVADRMSPAEAQKLREEHKKTEELDDFDAWTKTR